MARYLHTISRRAGTLPSAVERRYDQSQCNIFISISTLLSGRGQVELHGQTWANNPDAGYQLMLWDRRQT